MKKFFKKHPELLVLLAVVIIIDAFIVWMWLADLSATAKSKQAYNNLDRDAQRINNSDWRVNSQNAALAEEELETWEKHFNDLLSKQQDKYAFDIDYKENMTRASVARMLKTKIDNLSQLLKEKDKTPDSLSFSEFTDTKKSLSMSGEEIRTVFISLKGLKQLVHKCIEADIISLDKVQRPMGLSFETNKSISTKRYTYLLSLTVTGSSFKKLLNKISNDESYFFEINNLNVDAIEQVKNVNNDLVPRVSRLGKIGPTTSKNPTPSIDEDEDDEPVIYKDSISPFSQAVYKIQISVDWIQFVKEL